MKITGARNEPFAAIRKRALAQAGAQTAAARALPADKAGFNPIGFVGSQIPSEIKIVDNKNTC